ncbi:MAG: VWA domain-containing protein [Acidobacteriota bacterium]
MPDLRRPPASTLSRLRSRRRLLAVLVCLATLVGVATAGAETAPSPDLVLVLDASGSMWGQIDGEPKIAIARDVLGDLLDGLDAEQRVGLLAYGHRQKGDCDDIELVAPVAPLDRAAMAAHVEALNPKGKTPITASIERAFEAVPDAADSTVIVVTDGLETCGGDPCAAVRAARDAGHDFVLHIIGFDVADEDVSQLECAAQAGGGRFLSAEDAGSLAAALDAASELTVETPIGALVVEATADGELQDVAVRVSDAAGEEVGIGRTYTDPGTNPRRFPLADGSYTAAVRAVGIDGDRERTLTFEIIDGATVEKAVDFSTGQLSIGITRNGELSDASYRVYVASSADQAAVGRTYTSATSNPASERLTAGRYRVVAKSVEIEGRPEKLFDEIDLEPGGEVSLLHDYQSGTLRVGVERAGELIDAVVQIKADRQVAQSRTYTSAKSNPKTFVLEPGTYTVSIQEIRGEKVERTAEVTAGETETLAVELN